MEKICKTCTFFISGCCRRFPPTVAVYSDSPGEDGYRYPHTEYVFPDENHWCGEWRAKENV